MNQRPVGLLDFEGDAPLTAYGVQDVSPGWRYPLGSSEPVPRAMDLDFQKDGSECGHGPRHQHFPSTGEEQDMGTCYTWLDIDFFCSFNRRKKTPN